MSVSSFPNATQLDASFFVAATVHSVGSDGDTIVVFRDNPETMLCCSVLHPVGGCAKVPRVGCPVLVWRDTVNSRGVIVGTLEAQPEEASLPVPDELVIEARESL